MSPTQGSASSRSSSIGTSVVFVIVLGCGAGLEAGVIGYYFYLLPDTCVQVRDAGAAKFQTCSGSSFTQIQAATVADCNANTNTASLTVDTTKCVDMGDGKTFTQGVCPAGSSPTAAPTAGSGSPSAAAPTTASTPSATPVRTPAKASSAVTTVVSAATLGAALALAL